MGKIRINRIIWNKNLPRMGRNGLENKRTGKKKKGIYLINIYNIFIFSPLLEHFPGLLVLDERKTSFTVICLLLLHISLYA